jgi:hypothetical protein
VWRCDLATACPGWLNVDGLIFPHRPALCLRSKLQLLRPALAAQAGTESGLPGRSLLSFSSWARILRYWSIVAVSLRGLSGPKALVGTVTVGNGRHNGLGFFWSPASP